MYQLQSPTPGKCFERMPALWTQALPPVREFAYMQGRLLKSDSMYLHELRLQGFYTPDKYDFKCAACDGVFVGSPDHCMAFTDNPALSNEFKRDQLTGQNNHSVVNNIFFCEPSVFEQANKIWLAIAEQCNGKGI